MKILFNENILSDGAYTNIHGTNFWGNYGAGILPLALNTSKFLIGKRSPHVNEPNTWGVFGGKIDDEEAMNFKHQAIQEFEEETGYSGTIELYPAYVYKDSEGTFEYHNFIGIIPKEFHPTLNWETSKTQWVTFNELMKISPKHFGLTSLLNDRKSIELMKKLM